MMMTPKIMMRPVHVYYKHGVSKPHVVEDFGGTSHAAAATEASIDEDILAEQFVSIVSLLCVSSIHAHFLTLPDSYLMLHLVPSLDKSDPIAADAHYDILVYGQRSSC
ncbi:hypothetical protein PIB30_047134 [Stylosanthes scabra]|uniref:Uncharacterized protein n=1 Tax=Stylosanthes scabra TaxID=79078 RepID=A0ABU6VFR1_9FABA|nr:hypothetical protein [Stylosanthes scabra]